MQNCEALMIIGFGMFLTDKGKVWHRTDKVDANHDLIRKDVGEIEEES